MAESEKQVVPKNRGIIKKVVAGGVLFIAGFSVCLGMTGVAKKNTGGTDQGVSGVVSNIDSTSQAGGREYSEKQLGLIKSYGEPPDGFIWADDGSLIAVGTEDMTAEGVAFSYLKALSLLDMATASKYARTSTVCTRYNNFYGVDSSESYYTQFTRKLYGASLKSIEVDELTQQAVFANGRYILTFDVKVLDLTNKDFWQDNQEEIFNKLYTFSQTESDTTKAMQYIMDLILEYFQSEEAIKRSVKVELVLDKVYEGGWLITDDMDLNMYCSYEDGTSVYTYIMEKYGEWIDSRER